MARSHCASAPGKMVLIGEYAVTQGLPALSMAVNRRAQACRKVAKDKYHYVTSSLADTETYCFSILAGKIHWQESIPAVEIINFTQNLPWPDTRPENKGIDLRLDTSAFYNTTPEINDSAAKKFGIGSSAALLLAASRLLDPAAPNMASRHTGMQQQLGSGIDVATSTQAGLICFQKDQALKSLQLPENFFWQAVWTGNSAKTTDFLQAFESWRRQQAVQWQASKQQAAIIIAAAITATGRGDGLALVANLRAYGEWMRTLGQQIGQAIYTSVFEDIRQICQTEAVAWKPSGAGGGDIGIICAADRQKLSQISRTISDAGYTILNLELELEGLKDEG